MRFVLAFLFSILTFFAFGQPGGGPPPDPGTPVPLGGIEILLLAGAAIGIKKIMREKKSR
jgi:hypothetical protein